MTDPVETAIAPLREEAIAKAEIKARELAARVYAQLELADWDLNVAAPRPRATMRRQAYKEAASRFNLFCSLTIPAKATRSINEPHIRLKSDEHLHNFVKQAKREAAAQYDAFVAKLTKKIGPTTAATLEGSHVWGFSILTVTTAAGATQRWKTQQIVNVSSLGKLFNQWPSRLLKGG
jgi:hypothetical protein